MLRSSVIYILDAFWQDSQILATSLPLPSCTIKDFDTFAALPQLLHLCSSIVHLIRIRELYHTEGI
jgi:hypothetical protein